jgi:CubicO group peptidase (beta-lactamase class C family)
MDFKMLLLFVLTGSTVCAQISESEVDVLVERTLKTFNVPGIAVGIVKDGKLVLAKGYGVTNIKSGQKVNANTLFGIASNSKSFTSAALAILVDEGKINWDDKVIKYLPEFRMYNDYVTNEFTIRDLLTHRSGLGLGAGDLMIWPDGHDFTPEDIVKNIQYLKPVSPFRTKYDYDNLLYVIAGEVIEKVSGESWCDFVETRIMQPIEMTKSAASWSRLKDTANTIVPHVPTNGKLEVIPRYKNHIFDAAAGIYSSVTDLSKWLIVQLNDGKYNTNKQLFSKKQHDEMWKPQTIMSLPDTHPYKTLFRNYALGWRVEDINGHLQVSHTGALDGVFTQTLMIPELKLGIIVLTNQQSAPAFSAISNTIKDSYLGIKNPDHILVLSAKTSQEEDNADKITDEVWTTVAKNIRNKVKIDNSKYIGNYKDPWFGLVLIQERKGKLYFVSNRSKRLIGELFYYKDQNFAVKWDVRSFHADAYIFFDVDANGQATHFKMKAISPLTDFSYDFHDLDFTKDQLILIR